jgi:hypothetical protein
MVVAANSIGCPGFVGQGNAEKSVRPAEAVILFPNLAVDFECGRQGCGAGKSEHQ